MPVIYLSPSTQEYNEYVTGGNEEYYANVDIVYDCGAGERTLCSAKRYIEKCGSVCKAGRYFDFFHLYSE